MGGVVESAHGKLQSRIEARSRTRRAYFLSENFKSAKKKEESAVEREPFAPVFYYRPR